jgi:hypothetical protein
LLHVEVSWARVSQSGLKAIRGAAQVVHVAPSRRSREDQTENGRVNATDCVGPCYPYFAIVIVSDFRGILVF